MTDLLVGVDVGTTHLKVGVFDADGGLLASAQRGCPPSYHSDGTVEVDVQCWWDAFVASFGECLRAVGGSAIRAIGVSSQAQTYLLTNEEDEPLGPAVSWLDNTGDAEATSRDLAAHDYHLHTGWARPMPSLAACTLRRHVEGEDGWPEAARLLFADGYLMFRLTGRFGVSRNLAAMSGLYSMQRHDWWPEALESARVPPEALPSLLEVGQVAAELDPSLACEWGMEAVPVVAGANDQTAAAIGSALSEPGQVALGLGTAFVAYQVVEAGAPAPGSRPYRGPYIGDLEYQLGICDTAGAVMEWTRDLVAPRREWDRIIGEALFVEPGCGGLRVNPDFAGEDAAAGSGGRMAGSVVGLRLGHEARHVVRAVLEGVACAVREQLDALEATGVVRVTGGGSANEGWLQMLADVSGRTLERQGQPQATLWGTALMAGHGAGLFPDLLEAACARRTPGERLVSAQDKAAVYAEVYDDYLQIKCPGRIRSKGSVDVDSDLGGGV